MLNRGRVGEPDLNPIGVRPREKRAGEKAVYLNNQYSLLCANGSDWTPTTAMEQNICPHSLCVLVNFGSNRAG